MLEGWEIAFFKKRRFRHTSKKPQFSQASLIFSMVAALSSPFSFSMLITGNSISLLLTLQLLSKVKA